MDSDSGFIDRLEIVETGRRRRWSIAEKTRTVEESLTGGDKPLRRRGAITTPTQSYREGRLDNSATPELVSARIVAGEVGAAGLLPTHGEIKMELRRRSCLRCITSVVEARSPADCSQFL